MRDITLEDTIYIGFTTRAFATGIPTTLAGTPVVSAYEDAGLTQITAGITLGVDHDGVTGFHMLTIAATSVNGYGSGQDYNLTITTGTVGGVSVVGEIVGGFTVGRSAAAVDLANGTDGLGAIKATVDAIPTTAMRGTDSAATATNLSTVDTVVDGIQADLSNVTDGLGAIKGAVDAIPTTAMRGTDGANTATPLTALQVNAEVDTALNTAIPGTPTANSINERIKTMDDADMPTAIAAIPTTMVGTNNAATSAKQDTMEASLGTVTKVGPTKAEMDTAHGLLATEAKQDIIDTAVDAIKLKTDNQPEGIQKNATLSNFEVLMVDSTDHVTPKTGLTVTGQRSVDGGAFANVAGTIAEVGSGIYQFDALAADTNGDLITWKFNGGATADDAFVTFKTVT